MAKLGKEDKQFLINHYAVNRDFHANRINALYEQRLSRIVLLLTFFIVAITILQYLQPILKNLLYVEYFNLFLISVIGALLYYDVRRNGNAITQQTELDNNSVNRYDDRGRLYFKSLYEKEFNEVYPPGKYKKIN